MSHSQLLLRKIIPFIFFALIGAGTNVWAASAIQGSIQVQGDLIHLELEGRSSWIYDLKKIARSGKHVIQMSIDSLSPKSMEQIRSFKSDLVTGVRIDPKGPDGKAILSFELADEHVETFDYMTDQPSRLIVDFFISDAHRARLKKNAAKAAADKKEREKREVVVIVEDDRKPASDALAIADHGPVPSTLDTVHAGIFDAADPNYERFAIKDYEIKDEAILKAKNNFYISFPVLMSPNEGTLRIRATPTFYSIAPKDGEENKMARLLLNLFEKKRWSVYLKTLGWFKEKYPESEYNDLISYMTGDVYYSRWKDRGAIEDYELASQTYKAALQKYPAVAPAQKASFLIGDMALERGDILAAIRGFDAHIAHKQWPAKGVYSKDLAKMGLGFAYMKLMKPDEAFKAFDELEKSTSFEDLRIEAAYRKGDVFSLANQHAKAIELYRRALKTYPTGRSRFAGATYNQAESLFQLGDYRTALDTYRDYVKSFPVDSEVPYAMTRIGELLEILGADPRRVIGAYLETYFRFGESPKGVVSRLRLLSARMKGMKTKETDMAVKKILDLSNKLELPNIHPFATILIADGYTRRGEYQKSIDLLSDYYKQNPTAPDLTTFRNRIIANIGEKLRSEVQSGHFVDALKTHQVYADSWLKGNDRLDIKYYLGRAFEMGGVFKEAQNVYKDVLNRVYAMRGTPQEKQIAVLEHLPPVESLNLRLANAEYENRNYQAAYDQLRQIKDSSKLTEDEQIERVSLAAHLFEQKGEMDSAIRYLSEILREWQGRPELVAEPYLRLAQMELRLGNTKEAERSLAKVDTLMKDSGKVPPKVHRQALEKWAELLTAQGEKRRAIKVYGDLLAQYEDKAPMASIRYRLGRIHFELGEIQKAAEVWETFKGDSSGFWRNLAQEQLKNSDWKEDYNKYLRRIPAMAQDQETAE